MQESVVFSGACTMSLQRKFMFAISSPDEFLVVFWHDVGQPQVAMHSQLRHFLVLFFLFHSHIEICTGFSPWKRVQSI